MRHVSVRSDANKRTQAVPKSPPTFQLHAQASYLLVGGLGGIGLEIAKWMVNELGAKSLILISRSGMDASGAADAVEALQRSGAVITVRKCDVTDTTALSAVLHDCSQTLPSIRGVVQGAMVLKVSPETFFLFTRQRRVLANYTSSGFDLPQYDPQQLLHTP